MDIIQLTKDFCTWDKVLQLLIQQDHEHHYFSTLGLTVPQQHKYLLSKIMNRMEKLTDRNMLFAIQKNNEFLVLFGVDFNTFHSEIFNRTIIEIGPVYVSKESVIEEIAEPISRIIQECMDCTDPYFKVKLDSTNTMAIEIFNTIGFTYSTSAVKMLFNPQRYSSKFQQHFELKSKYAENDYYVRRIQFTDFKIQLNNLIEQHRKSIHYLMYKNDFEESKVQELFTEWFQLHNQKKQTILLGLFSRRNQLIGFTCCNGPINIHTASVYTRDVTIIDQPFKGKGLAGLLYKELHSTTNTFIEGNPLSDNYRNIQLNLNCGYSIVHSRVYFKMNTRSS